MTTAQPDGKYDQFSRLYDERKDIYERACNAVFNILDELLGDLRKREQWKFRYQLDLGRVKEKGRLFAKAEAQCPDASPEQIFERVSDIVGVRVVCYNLSDVHLVAMAIQDVAIKESRRLRVRKGRDALQDNIDSPLPSGYRALHLLVDVPLYIGRRKTWVCCEIQLRTLLQDAWGILTHEDIYKPDVPPPPLVEKLSKRLGDALAVLDEIAQDIREEIEKEAAPPGPPEPAAKPRQAEAVAAPPEGAPALTAEAVVGAFEAVRGRSPSISDQSMRGVLDKAAEQELSSPEIVEQYLRTTREQLDALYAEYGIKPSDFDYLWDGAWMHHDPARAESFLRGWLDGFAWTLKYAVGQAVPVTVTHIVPYGAFVQLQDGTKGLIHVSEMADHWVDHPSDIVEEGKTYSARIVSVDADKRRLAFTLKSG